MRQPDDSQERSEPFDPSGPVLTNDRDRTAAERVDHRLAVEDEMDLRRDGESLRQ